MLSNKEKREAIKESTEMSVKALQYSNEQEFSDAALVSKETLDKNTLQVMLTLLKGLTTKVFESADQQVVDGAIQAFNDEGKKILDSFVESIVVINRKVYEEMIVAFKVAIQKMCDDAYKD
ncbi:hypothetical protein LCGC14_1219680 [marine sediment metagenome]|uniref:Uncharacterized protein n=1 Tax=marine sediment metagenome TaxID=412755 RepID=A0A0F9LB07_9ZZZZ